MDAAVQSGDERRQTRHAAASTSPSRQRDASAAVEHRPCSCVCVLSQQSLCKQTLVASVKERAVQSVVVRQLRAQNGRMLAAPGGVCRLCW
jgi:hypothetical protein